MSLFPAYSAKKESDKLLSEPEGSSWLTNTSFDTTIFSKKYNPEDVSSSPLKKENNKDLISSHKKMKKKKKKKPKVKSHKAEHFRDYSDTSIKERTQDERFFYDKKSEKGNLTVATLSRPAIPKYHTNYKLILKPKHMVLMSCLREKKKADSCRYFKIKQINKLKHEETPADENSSESKIEQSMSAKVGEYNSRLSEDPSNVSLWLEYVTFQDNIKLLDIYNKSQNHERITAEKKLAILDKAMASNPLSQELMKERIKIAENIFTFDQMAEYITRCLERDPANVILWHSLIANTRNSLTNCSVPRVLQLFTKAIERLHQLRRGASKSCVQTYEGGILSLLMECGLFLQQAGLWEQLWTLLQLYLTVNLSLSDPNLFKFQVTLPETELIEKEEAVIHSGLPLATLWMRVEHIRSSIHFLPVESSDDPQRVVFPEDVSSLHQPLTSPDLNLLLVTITFVLLKVPLLPSRHCVLQLLNLHESTSYMDNVEYLLAATYPTGLVLDIAEHYEYFSAIADLTLEPQFLRNTFGSSEYLSWLVSVMNACANQLPLSDGVIVHCWILRFYKYLLRLEKLKLTTVPNFLAKKAKSYAKELLKLPKYRDCLQLYIEFALLEREIGNIKTACHVLETTAKLRYNIPDSERSVYTALCRALVDTMLQDSQTERYKVIGVLVSLVEIQPMSLHARSSTEIKQSLNKSEHMCLEILPQAAATSTANATLNDCFTYHLCVEWVACHAWFLYLTQSVWAGTSFIEQALAKFPNTAQSTVSCVWREQLWEIYISMLHYHVNMMASTGYSVLRETLHRAVSEFPNNLCFLHTVASLETHNGSPWWKLVTYFPANSALPKLMLIFLARFKLTHKSGDLEQYRVNLLYNLLKQLTSNPTTKKCPLVWRLYLQFVMKTQDRESVKNVFYKAIEACPGAKCLYFEAAQCISEELSEIQDLLIEKELRLHTTPEELEVLRSKHVANV